MLMAANVENRDTGTSAALQIQPTRRDWLYVFHRRASSEDASASRSGRPELLPNLMEFVCLALHFNVVEKRAEPYSDASTELLGPQSPAPGARIVPMGECASEPRGGHLGGSTNSMSHVEKGWKILRMPVDMKHAVAMCAESTKCQRQTMRHMCLGTVRLRFEAALHDPRIGFLGKARPDGPDFQHHTILTTRLRAHVRDGTCRARPLANHTEEETIAKEEEFRPTAGCNKLGRRVVKSVIVAVIVVIRRFVIRIIPSVLRKETCNARTKKTDRPARTRIDNCVERRYATAIACPSNDAGMTYTKSPDTCDADLRDTCALKARRR